MGDHLIPRLHKEVLRRGIMGKWESLRLLIFRDDFLDRTVT